MKIIPFASHQERSAQLPEVVAHLEAGGLIAYPTETVYGLGCLLLPAALEALARLKGGRDDKAFLLLIAEPDVAAGLTWTDDARRLANCFWPGPLTIALSVEARHYPRQVVGPDRTVAVRVSPHPAVQQLVHALGVPLTSTSANRPGEAPAVSAEQVASLLTDLAAQDTLVLDGGLIAGQAPSTIVDCSHSPPRMLRSGAITSADIQRCLHDHLRA